MKHRFLMPRLVSSKLSLNASLLSIVAMALCATPALGAGSGNWNGSTSTDFNTAANWSGGNLSGNGIPAGNTHFADIYLTGAANTTVNTTSVNQYNFNFYFENTLGTQSSFAMTGGTYNWGGSELVTSAVTSGSITDVFDSNLSFNNGTARTFNLGANHHLNIGGNLSSSLTTLTVSKTGAGTLTFSGTNTLAGPTSVSSGIVNSTAAFTTPGLTIQNTGTVNLPGGAFTLPQTSGANNGVGAVGVLNINSGGLLNISGGSHAFNERSTINGTFRVNGSASTIRMNQIGTANGTFDFIFDSGGVSAITGNLGFSWLNIGGASVIVDGSAFSGTGSFTLFDSDNNGTMPASNNFTINGLGTEGVDWTLDITDNPGGSAQRDTVVLNVLGATVNSITRRDANPSKAASVSWDVTFADPVSGLSVSNFSLAETGSVSGSSITGVTGSGTDYVVTASPGGGCGTLVLSLSNDTGTSPRISNEPFSGEAYSIGSVAAVTLLQDSFGTAGAPPDQGRVYTFLIDTGWNATTGYGSPNTPSLWNITGGRMENPTATDPTGNGSAYTGSESPVWQWWTNPAFGSTSLKTISISFDYDIGAGDTLFAHFWAVQAGGAAGSQNRITNNQGWSNGNSNQNQASDTAGNTPYNLSNGSNAPSNGSISGALSGSGTYTATIDVSTLGISGVSDIGDINQFFFAFAMNEAGGGTTSVDNLVISAIPEDIVAPVINCAKDIVVSIPAGETTDPISYDTTALDACDGPVEVDFSPPSGSTFPVGVHPVTATATDSEGNVATATFNVVVLAIAETPGGRFIDASAVSGDAATGTDVPAGATFSNIYNAYLNNGGGVLFSANLDGGTTGVFSGGSTTGPFTAIAVQGAASGAGPYGKFSDLTLNDAGDTGFASRLSSGPAHFANAAPSAVQGGVATATGGGEIYRSLQKPALASGGVLLTRANLVLGSGAPGVTVFDDTVITGNDTTLLAREGDPTSIGGGVLYSGLHSRVVASEDNNHYAFTAFLKPSSLSLNTAVFTGTVGGGAPVVVAREGDAAPGTGGGDFESFQAEVINGAGEIALRGTARGAGITSADSSGIWTNSGGSLELVAREGAAVPCMPPPFQGLVAFDRFTTLAIADDGSVHFFAYLRNATPSAVVNSGNDGSIWRWEDGELYLIAREGDAANNTDGGEIGRIDTFACSGAGGVVYRVEYVMGQGDATSVNRDGIYLDRGAGDAAPELVLRRGDSFDFRGESRTVTRLDVSTEENPGNGTGGYGRAINDAGDILLDLSLSGNFTGIFVLSSGTSS